MIERYNFIDNYFHQLWAAVARNVRKPIENVNDKIRWEIPDIVFLRYSWIKDKGKISHIRKYSLANKREYRFVII